MRGGKKATATKTTEATKTTRVKLQKVVVVVGLPPGVKPPSSKKRKRTKTCAWTDDEIARGLDGVVDAIARTHAVTDSTPPPPSPLTTQPDAEMVCLETEEEAKAMIEEAIGDDAASISVISRLLNPGGGYAVARVLPTYVERIVSSATATATGTATATATATGTSTTVQQIVCHLLRRLEELADIEPHAAVGFVPAITRISVPWFLRRDFVSLVTRLLSATHDSVLPSFASAIFGSVVPGVPVDSIDALRERVRQCESNRDLVRDIAIASEAAILSNRHALDIFVTSLELTGKWSVADVGTLLRLIWSISESGQSLDPARLRSVIATCALRSTLTLDTVLQCLRFAACGVESILLACDLLDGVQTAHSFCARQQSDIPLGRWSASILVEAFAALPNCRSQIVDFVLLRLATGDSTAANTAECAISGLMERFETLVEESRDAFESWLLCNAHCCSVRAADVISTTIASKGCRSAHKLALSLMTDPHTRSAQTGIALACQLLLVPFVWSNRQYRTTLLKKLLNIATTSPCPRLVRAAFDSLSMACDMLSREEYSLVLMELAAFAGRAILSNSKTKCDGSVKGLCTDLVTYSPHSVMVAHTNAPIEVALRAGESGTIVPLFECLCKYHQRESADQGVSSVEMTIEALIASDNVCNPSAVLGVQAMAAVVVKSAASLAIAADPSEAFLAGSSTGSLCELAMDCAAMSRAMRLNVLSASAQTLGKRSGVLSECAVDPVSSAICLPYLNACSEECGSKSITNRLLSERSVILELLRNVERNSVEPSRDMHALAFVAGEPSLSAAFSASPALATVLGSPQFLRWSVAQSTELSQRIDSVRRLYPSTSKKDAGRQLWHLETEVLRHHYLILKRAIWHCLQTSELSLHVLSQLGYEANSFGVSSFIETLRRQFELTSDRTVAVTLLDLLYVIGLHREASAGNRRSVAKMFKTFLCSTYSSTAGRNTLRIPADVPRVSPIPNIPRPVRMVQHLTVHHALRCFFSLLLPLDALSCASDLLDAMDCFDPGTRKWGRNIDEHPTYRSLSECTLPVFFVEVAFAVAVQMSFDPEHLSTQPPWSNVVTGLQLLRRLVELRDVASTCRHAAVSYVLRCITWVLSSLKVRLSLRPEIQTEELLSLDDAFARLSCSIGAVAKGVQKSQRVLSANTARIPRGLPSEMAAISKLVSAMKVSATRRPSRGSTDLVSLPVGREDCVEATEEFEWTEPPAPDELDDDEYNARFCVL